jgi:hypothetical protein
VLVALVARLIGVTHRGVLQLGVQLRHGLLQRLADQSVGLRHRPQTEAHAHDVREHRLHFALRQVELPSQRAHQGQSARTELAAGNPCGKRSVVLTPTTCADATQSHVLAHDRLDLGQLEDLMAHGFIAIDLDR